MVVALPHPGEVLGALASVNTASIGNYRQFIDDTVSRTLQPSIQAMCRLSNIVHTREYIEPLTIHQSDPEPRTADQ